MLCLALNSCYGQWMPWQCGNELVDVSLFVLPFCFPLSMSSMKRIFSFSQSADRSTACRQNIVTHHNGLQQPCLCGRAADLALFGSVQTPSSANSSSFCPLQTTLARRPKRKQEDKKRKEDRYKSPPPGFL